MNAANNPLQRPPDAKLLFLSGSGILEHRARSSFAALLRPGDLVVANDAATLPASLIGNHVPTRRPIEVRLASRPSLHLHRVRNFVAVVFGEGDFRIRTEHRAPPPVLAPGDRLELGPLRAAITRLLDHPRLVLLRFEGSPREIWEGLARHGRPIQYAHIREPLALWDVWSRIAATPVAFEPPSAGYVLSWKLLASLASRGVQFATITHSAGLSSTGDPALDARLPFDEPYRIPASTAHAISRTRARNGRVIAVGTTVVRALEHAAVDGGVAAGEGLATERIGPSTQLRVVDALLSGTHERGTHHYDLLRAFGEERTLSRMDRELDLYGYRTHEFGDSIFIERAGSNAQSVISCQKNQRVT